MKKWWFALAGISLIIALFFLHYRICWVERDFPGGNGKTVFIIKKTNQYPRFYRSVLADGNSIERGDLIAFYDPQVCDIPLAERKIFIRRVIGLPGDIVQISDKNININQKAFDEWYPLFFEYRLSIDGINLQTLSEKFDIFCVDTIVKNTAYNITATAETASKIAGISGVVNLRLLSLSQGDQALNYFPKNQFTQWNKDYFGPVAVPQKGVSAFINYKNIGPYVTIIETYEDNTLIYSQSEVKINNTASDKYTFKKDYFFVLSDDRDHGTDSRYFGYIPEDYIIGKVVF